MYSNVYISANLIIFMFRKIVEYVKNCPRKHFKLMALLAACLSESNFMSLCCKDELRLTEDIVLMEIRILSNRKEAVVFPEVGYLERYCFNYSRNSLNYINTTLLTHFYLYNIHTA